MFQSYEEHHPFVEGPSALLEGSEHVHRTPW